MSESSQIPVPTPGNDRGDAETQTDVNVQNPAIFHKSKLDIEHLSPGNESETVDTGSSIKLVGKNLSPFQKMNKFVSKPPDTKSSLQSVTKQEEGDAIANSLEAGSDGCLSLSTAFDDSCWKSMESPDDLQKKENHEHFILSLDPTSEKVVQTDQEKHFEYSSHDETINSMKLENESQNPNDNDLSGDRNKVALASKQNEVVDNVNNDSIVRWADELSSPRTGHLFSPSKEMNKPTSLHGLGLTLTIDRFKQIIKCQTRLSKFIMSIGELLESYSQTILKSCQSHSASISSSNGAVAISALLNEIISSIFSFGKQTESAALTIQKSIARVLNQNVESMTQIIGPLVENYSISREHCTKARSKALKQKNRYDRAVKDAELSIKDLQKAKDKSKSMSIATANSKIPFEIDTCEHEGETKDEILSKAKPSNRITKSSKSLSRKSDRTLQALRMVQSTEKEYKEFVENENNAVSHAYSTESSALETLQKAEKDRLDFLYESYIRIVETEINALDNMNISFSQRDSRETPTIIKTEPVSSSLHSPSSLINKLLTFAEEGSGVDEAASLNLPVEIGQIRDKMKTSLEVKRQYLFAVKIVSTIVEEFACATEDFSLGLVSKLAHEGYTTQGTKSENLLSSFLGQVEGHTALKCWTEIIDNYINCSHSASELTQILRANNHKYLNKILSRSERDLRLTSEAEEIRWKNLCDAVRNETRAKQKLEQAMTDLAKAKERLSGCGENPGSEDDAGDKMNVAVRKALGNVFAILPSKGEETMAKILNPKARQAIAKTSYDETEAKLEKESESYKSMKKDLESSISLYLQSSQTTIKTMKKNELKIRNKIESNIDNALDSLQNFRVARYTSLKPAAELFREYRISGALSDMKDWSFEVNKKLSKHTEAYSDDDEPGPPIIKRKDWKTSSTKDSESNGSNGSSLSLKLATSPTVYGLIELLESNLEHPKTPNETEKNENSDALCSNESKTSDIEEFCISTGNFNKDKSSSSILAQNAEASKELQCSVDGEFGDNLSIELSSLAFLLKEAIENEQSIQDQQIDKPGELTMPPARATSAETEIFLQHFQGDEFTEPPTLLGSYSCAYHPKEDSGSPYYLLHGRMFATPESMYFVGWGETKLSVQWKDIISIRKEANVMGVVNNSLRIIADHGEGEKSYYFGSFAFRESCFQTINRLVAVNKSLVELVESDDEKKKGTNEIFKELPPVPIDATLNKMEVIFKKKLKGVTVQKFYDLCLAETNAPFYGPFLRSNGNQELHVSDWEFEQDKIVNEWCGEKYCKKRVITYKFKRTTHLYIGPPIASVTETQYCRIEGDDKCVMETNVAMQGIPYADVFNVEIRWVARRDGTNDLQIETGLFVDFKKSTLMKSKIRSGTIAETAPAQLKLFHAMKSLCEDGEEGSIDTNDDFEGEVAIDESATGNHRYGLDLKFFQDISKKLSIYLPTLERVQRFASSLDNIVIVEGLLFLLLFQWVITHNQSLTTDHSIVMTRRDFEVFAQKMDGIVNEIKETRMALQEIVALLKEEH